MNYLIFPLTLVSVFALATISFLMAPTMGANKNAPLGVSVPHERIQESSIKNSLASYRTGVTIAGVVAIILLVFSYRQPLGVILALGVLFGGTAWSYLRSRRQIIRVKTQEQWFEGIKTSISGRVSTREDETPPPIPWALFSAAVAVVLIGMLVVALHWESIPQVIPVHWNAAGEIDRWSEKNFFSVYTISLVALATILLLVGFAALLRNNRTHNRSDRSDRGQAVQQAQIDSMITGLGFLALCTALGMAIDQVVSQLPEYEKIRWLGTTAILVGVIIGAAAISLRAAARTQVVTSRYQHTPNSPDSDKYFRAGIFYYNRDDPAVFVDRRVGMGMGLNFATWQAQLLVVLFIVGVIASTLIAIILSN